MFVVAICLKGVSLRFLPLKPQSTKLVKFEIIITNILTNRFMTLDDFNLVEDWGEKIKNLELRLSNNSLFPVTTIVYFWMGVGEEKLLFNLFLYFLLEV